MPLRFGDVTVDIAARRLCQGATDQHLSPKAFDLLRLLLDNRPRALSKAEVHAHLWPSTFVSDATLTSLVAELRHALGESAGDARFVRTVHRFGYAFQGEVTDVAEPVPSARGKPRSWIVWEWGHAALADGDHVLGRDRDVAVWLESTSVSRRHARIRIAAGDATIEDLGSKNGTYLHGLRLTHPSPLRDGDEIRVGSVELRFCRYEAGGSTETLRAR